MKHKLLMFGGLIALAVIVVTVVELLMIKFGGSPVAVPNIPREPEISGSGKALRYVVMGDSTAVGQGGEYDKGIARSTAGYLARSNAVTLHNLGISGARAATVASEQLPQAVKLKPDIVMIAVGANDVTHLTSIGGMRKSMTRIIDALRAANPDVRIMLTGSPQMGSVPRFPQPVRYLAKAGTGHVNVMLAELAAEKNVTLAPLALETGPIFERNHDLFAVDKFHPTTEGYTVWVPTLERALAEALTQKTRQK